MQGSGPAKTSCVFSLLTVCIAPLDAVKTASREGVISLFPAKCVVSSVTGSYNIVMVDDQGQARMKVILF